MLYIPYDVLAGAKGVLQSAQSALSIHVCLFFFFFLLPSA
jgi:hypothetical protein